MSSLRTGGSMPPLPLYVCVAILGTTLPCMESSGSVQWITFHQYWQVLITAGKIVRYWPVRFAASEEVSLTAWRITDDIQCPSKAACVFRSRPSYDNLQRKMSKRIFKNSLNSISFWIWIIFLHATFRFMYQASVNCKALQKVSTVVRAV